MVNAGSARLDRRVPRPRSRSVEPCRVGSRAGRHAEEAAVRSAVTGVRSRRGRSGIPTGANSGQFEPIGAKWGLSGTAGANSALQKSHLKHWYKQEKSIRAVCCAAISLRSVPYSDRQSPSALPDGVPIIGTHSLSFPFMELTRRSRRRATADSEAGSDRILHDVQQRSPHRGDLYVGTMFLIDNAARGGLSRCGRRSANT